MKNTPAFTKLAVLPPEDERRSSISGCCISAEINKTVAR